VKKKFIDRWWVRLLALLLIPGMLSGGSSTVSGFLFLAMLILIFVRVSKNQKSRKSGGDKSTSESTSESLSADTRMPPEGTYLLIKASGNYLLGLAGESHYFDAISKAVHHRTGEHSALAEIIREPDNKFDSNAVRAEIEGRTVGYIPRELAPSFHSLLDYGNSINKRIFAPCRVWISDEEDSYGSVSLDIDDPNSALPPANAGEVPSSAIVWPTGNTIQVSEESKNIENVKQIFEKLRSAYGNSILLELVIDAANPKKPEVHVLFNGLKVGELSPASGKKFLPAVERATTKGKRLFVKGEATGNSLAAEVKIFAKSPELLVESEIQQLLG